MKKEHCTCLDTDSGCPLHERPVAPAPTASAREWPESAGYRAIFVRYDNFYILDPLDANEGKEVGRVVMSKRGFDAIAEAYASSQSSKLEGVGQEAADLLAKEVVRMLREEKRSGYNTAKSFATKFAAIIDELIAGRLA